MATVTPAVASMPAAPDPNDRATFNARAYPWSVALDTFADEVQAVADAGYANAVEASSAALSASDDAADAIAAKVAAEAAQAIAVGAVASIPSGSINDTITGAGSVWSSTKVSSELGGKASTASVSAKQDALVSGTNIKTINSTSVLGSGDIAISTGSWILLSTVNASNSATVDVETTFDSTYDEYVIKATGVTFDTGGVQIVSRAKVGGAYDTGSNYSSASAVTTSVGDAYAGNDGGSSMALTTAASTTSGRPSNFEFLVHNPASTTQAKTFDWRGFFHRNGATLGASFSGAGLNSSTSACTGVRFYMSSGLIVAGAFRLYGIKKA